MPERKYRKSWRSYRILDLDIIFHGGNIEGQGLPFVEVWTNRVKANCILKLSILLYTQEESSYTGDEVFFVMMKVLLNAGWGLISHAT